MLFRKFGNVEEGNRLKTNGKIYHMRGWRKKSLYFKSRLDLQYLFLTAIVVRLIYLALMLGQVEYPHLLEIAPDTVRYVNIAEGILGINTPDEDAVLIFGPGYGFFLSLVFFLFGKGALAVLLIQIILSSLSCLLIYKLGKELTDSKAVGLIAGYLLALSFTSISLANIILSDTLFFFLFLLGNLLFITGLKQNSFRHFIYSGVIIGLSVYIRSIGQMWPLAMLLLILIYPVKNKSLSWWKSRFVRLKRAWVAPVIALLLVSIWIGRNYAKHDYSIMAMAGPHGISKVTSLAESRIEKKSKSDIVTGWVEQYKNKRSIDSLTYIDYARMYNDRAYSSLLNNPGPMIIAYKDMLWDNIIAANELYRSQLPQMKDKILSRMEQYREERIPQICFWLGIAGLAGLFACKKYTAGIYLTIIHLYFICMCGFAQWQGSRVYFPNQIAWTILVSSLIVLTGPLSKKLGELIIKFQSLVEKKRKKQSNAINKSVLSVLITIPCLIFIGHALLYGNYIIDDAGISYTYAKNWADGYGLVHNIGGEKVEGYSNPLWVFLLGTLIKFGMFHPIIVPKIISIVFVILMFTVIFSMFIKFTMHLIRMPICFIVSLLVASNVSLTIWAVAGLENALFGFLIIYGIYRLWLEIGCEKKYIFSGLVLFLVCLTRPDGVVYLGASYFIAMFWIKNRRQLRIFIVNLFLFFAPFGLYHLWHYLYFSEWLPNTYFAKVRDVPLLYKLTEFNHGGWAYIRNCFSSYGLYILIPFSIASLWSRKKLLPAMLIAILVFSLLLPIISWGDWMMQFRILHPTIIIIFILSGLGFITFIDIFNKRHKIIGFLGLIILLLFGFLVFKSEQQYKLQKSYFTVPFTAIQNSIHGLNRNLGDSLGIVLPSVLCADLGATSYYGGLRIFDVGLLADYHLARYRFKDYYADYVFEEQRPDFISYQGGAVAQFTRMRDYSKFKDMYIAYEERHLDENYFGKNVFDGQYVRRDIITRDKIPFFAKQILKNETSLIAYYSPDYISPNTKRIPIILFWDGFRKDLNTDKFNISLIDSNDKVIFDSTYSVGYLWYPPEKWGNDKLIGQNVFVPFHASDNDSLYLSIYLGGIRIVSNKLITPNKISEEDQLFIAVKAMNNLAVINQGIMDYASLMHQIDPDFWKDLKGQSKIDDLVKTFLKNRSGNSISANHDSLWTLVKTIRQISPENNSINEVGERLHDFYFNEAKVMINTGWQSHRKAFEYLLRAVESFPSDPRARKNLEQMRPWVEYIEFHNRSLKQYDDGLPLTKALEIYRHFYQGSPIKFRPFDSFFKKNLMPRYEIGDVIDSLNIYDRVTLMQLGLIRIGQDELIKLGESQTFGNKKLEILDSRLVPIDSGKYLFEAVFIPHNIADRPYVLSLNTSGETIDDIPEVFRHRGTFPYSFSPLPPIQTLKEHIPNYVWRILEIPFEPNKYEITVFVSGGPPWYPLFNDNKGDNFVSVN
ncbi:MAG: glycosyltransferase family 39 protein [Candidatus Zixiibacteriota bacterium]